MRNLFLLLSFLMLFSACSSDEENEYSQVPQKTVQQRLNEGETPISIFNNGFPLDSIYGRNYKGGLIYHLNTNDGSGLVAHFQDNSSAMNWASLGNVTGANNSSIGFGQSNTNEIMSFYFETNTAADFCDNLVLNNYSDWFLPSKDEMQVMINRLKGKPNVFFGAVTGYWTSTNYNYDNVWIIRADKTAITTLKYSNNTYDIRVRATRKFEN